MIFYKNFELLRIAKYKLALNGNNSPIYHIHATIEAGTFIDWLYLTFIFPLISCVTVLTVFLKEPSDSSLNF